MNRKNLIALSLALSVVAGNPTVHKVSPRFGTLGASSGTTYSDDSAEVDADANSGSYGSGSDGFFGGDAVVGSPSGGGYSDGKNLSSITADDLYRLKIFQKDFVTLPRAPNPPGVPDLFTINRFPRPPPVPLPQLNIVNFKQGPQPLDFTGDVIYSNPFGGGKGGFGGGQGGGAYGAQPQGFVGSGTGTSSSTGVGGYENTGVSAGKVRIPIGDPFAYNSVILGQGTGQPFQLLGNQGGGYQGRAGFNQAPRGLNALPQNQINRPRFIPNKPQPQFVPPQPRGKMPPVVPFSQLQNQRNQQPPRPPFPMGRPGMGLPPRQGQFPGQGRPVFPPPPPQGFPRPQPGVPPQAIGARRPF